MSLARDVDDTVPLADSRIAIVAVGPQLTRIISENSLDELAVPIPTVLIERAPSYPRAARRRPNARLLRVRLARFAHGQEESLIAMRVRLPQ